MFGHVSVHFFSSIDYFFVIHFVRSMATYFAICCCSNVVSMFKVSPVPQESCTNIDDLSTSVDARDRWHLSRLVSLPWLDVGRQLLRVHE